MGLGLGFLVREWKGREFGEVQLLGILVSSLAHNPRKVRVRCSDDFDGEDEI